MKLLALLLTFAAILPTVEGSSVGGLGPRSDNAQVSVSGYLQGYFDRVTQNFQVCAAAQEHDLKKCIDLIVPERLAPRAAKLRGQCIVAKGKFNSYANNIVTGYVYSDTGMVTVSSLARCIRR